MSNTFEITPLIPGLVNEVAIEIFLHFVAIDWDGPFTLVLVCTAWRDTVLRSRSLKSMHCDRRRPNQAVMKNRDKARGGICIVSFDGGGPGSMSQLRILAEFMARLACEKNTEVDELHPADYFDLMGGVGFGGLAALLLGRLRMNTTQAMEELATIGTSTFRKGDDLITPEVTIARLRNAIESMLVRHGHSVDMKLRDSSSNRCKLVLFAAPTLVMDHCHPFRSYPSSRISLECTLVDAACATMATPEYFSSVSIGPRLRKQSFAGTPHNLDNPIREVLKEAKLVFGEKSPVSLVLSLGSGQRPRLSDLDLHVTRRSRIHCDDVARDLENQIGGLGEYLRLNVDKGLEKIDLDDWHELGSIETHTEVYLEIKPITEFIDAAAQWLLQRKGSVNLGQLCGASTERGVKFASEALTDYLAMEFKQMHDVIQQCGIAKITLVDAIGNDIPIPTQFCVTYSMLLDVISVHFRHQKAPGSDFVERGDYRLIHGDRRNVMGAIEWAGIEKVGLKVEMSMILRTRNEDKERCPRCRARFEGRSIGGWAQCLSCTVHFHIETQIQIDADDQSDNLEPSGVVPSGKESQSTGSAGAVELQFRLISVINLLEINDFEVHPTARLLYDSLPQYYRDVFNNCRMYSEKHLEFVKYLQHLSLNDLDKKNEPSSERNLIKSLGIPVSTEEGDKKKWQCGVVGCEYKGTLQHLVSHLRTKSHIGMRTFACTLDCKILFHRSEDRNRHVKERTCLKSRQIEVPPSTRSLRGVQDQLVTKPKVKSRSNQHLERERRSQISAQTSAQGANDPQTKKAVHYDPSFQAPGNGGHYNPGLWHPLHLTHAYNHTHSNVPAAQDGRVGMRPASHPLLTPDLFRTPSILPTNYGGMHPSIITNNYHIHSSNPQITPALQPVNPRFNHPTSLTSAYPGFYPRVTTGYQDPRQSSTSHSANFAGNFYGDDPPQWSHIYRGPHESRQPPYVGVSNRPEAWGVTGVKKEEEMRVELESDVVAMDVTP